jgi:integrase
VAEVPRTLRGILGKKRFVQSLQTTEIEVARAARWKALQGFKAQITAQHHRRGTQDDPISEEALALREHLARADDKERDDLMYYITDRAEQIDIRERGAIEEPRSLEEQDRDVPSQKASDFVRLATGKATPLLTYEDRWLASSGYTDRTKADARSALRHFRDWSIREKRSAFTETVDDLMASDFRDAELVKAGVHPKTANKKLSALRQYWAWLDKSLGIRPNPWAGKSLAKPKLHRVSPDGPDGQERPFTDDEMRTLFLGNADADLADLIRIAALSGMRLEEIGQLRIRNCREDCFAVQRGKTAAAVRTVPIHSALRKLVAYRVRNKRDDAFLFPDLPDTGWDNNRTMAVSKRFAYYRKRLGVNDKRPGARRSKVNFHSFRRWFATKAEEAGQRENVVAAIMGHRKDVGITFNLYSKAELFTLKRQCVEAVKLRVRVTVKDRL